LIERYRTIMSDARVAELCGGAVAAALDAAGSWVAN
jgi:hypothetical protein